MKIDEVFLTFPKHLPNDLEGFIFYYPEKFPPIASYFEEVARKIGHDPQAYKDYGYWAQKQMFAELTLIKEDFEKGNQEDLSFLVAIDQRLSKLFCYRFWLVNYLFADGPLHEFYVDNLKNLVRKVVDITEDVEDYEAQVIQVQHDLLQTDYADLYLQQALNGVEIVDIFEKNERIKPLLEQVSAVLGHSNDNKKNKEQVENFWKKIIAIIQDKNDSDYERLQLLFTLPLNQVQMRKTMVPLYAFLTHTVEFKEENKALKIRHDQMNVRIADIMGQANQKLSSEDFELLRLSYNQARNLSMFKDVMGEVDPFLLPFWFAVVHKKVKDILSKSTKLDPSRSTGHGGMFSYLVWFLPKDLKDVVMTPDYEPYEFRGDVDAVLKRSSMWNAWAHPVDETLI